jgi:hypothetical protein
MPEARRRFDILAFDFRAFVFTNWPDNTSYWRGRDMSTGRFVDVRKSEDRRTAVFTHPAADSACVFL